MSCECPRQPKIKCRKALEAAFKLPWIIDHPLPSKADSGAPWTRTTILVEFFPTRCWGGEWSVIRTESQWCSHACYTIKSTRLVANANRPEGISVFLESPYHTTKTTQTLLPSAIQNPPPYFHTPRWPFSRLAGKPVRASKKKRKKVKLISHHKRWTNRFPVSSYQWISSESAKRCDYNAFFVILYMFCELHCIFNNLKAQITW
jgi:hypothetical protein